MAERKKPGVVIGMQRSGTKFLERLLCDAFGNFVAKNTWDNGGIWKHAVFVSKQPKLLKKVVVFKQPEMWAASIIRKPDDILIQKRGNNSKFHKNIYAIGGWNYKGLAELYEQFHTYWRGQKVCFVSFEYLISTEARTRAVVEWIGREWRLGPSRPYDIPKKIDGEPVFGKAERERYKNGDHGLLLKNLLEFQGGLNVRWNEWKTRPYFSYQSLYRKPFPHHPYENGHPGAGKFIPESDPFSIS